MSTQLEEARRGEITPAMVSSARSENMSPDKIRDKVALGHAVIPLNPAHPGVQPTVVGRAFRTKINANIGRSADCSSSDAEVAKVAVAVDAGADFVMDLSVGPDLGDLRRDILSACSVPLGTVPIYEALARAGGDVEKLEAEHLLEVVTEHAEQGVDFMTLHAGLMRAHIPLALKRTMGIVSRGGAILARWMTLKDRENPLYSRWDDVLQICQAHDVTISLGDALRPGCLADASDEAQFAELKTLGKLVAASREAGVQVMVEGPGHVPFDQIQMNMEKEQELCDNAPFYVLGPVVTDIAPGYDHITSCIGATAAAYYGASLLCYVTPAEHLRLPTNEDVKAGVIAYRIAAHAADVARGLPGARQADDEMAKARMAFDWKKQFALAMDGETAREMYQEAGVPEEDRQEYCSMCGKDFCAVRATKELAGK